MMKQAPFLVLVFISRLPLNSASTICFTIDSPSPKWPSSFFLEEKPRVISGGGRVDSQPLSFIDITKFSWLQVRLMYIFFFSFFSTASMALPRRLKIAWLKRAGFPCA